MSEPLDLHTATIHSSPRDIADWPETVKITRVRCDPRGGFRLDFDKVIPENWKWPSNPADPSDNFQFTVWAFVQVNGQWHGAGFVQMWQGRSMDAGALPAIFAVNDGAQGYKNWWGDVRHLWGEMSDYVPQPGDAIHLMVSAGNARLVPVVTSVRERSNVVQVMLRASDEIDVSYTEPPPIIVPPGPIVPPPKPLPTTDLTAVLKALDAQTQLLNIIYGQQVADRVHLDAVEKQILAAAKRIEAKLTAKRK